jgi:hypothetical protein
VFEDLVVDVVEVEKICSDLSNPVRLYQDDGTNIDHGHFSTQEWFVLHP